MTEVGSYLNTQDGTSYVFSGNQTSTPAYNPANLPNPGDLTTNVAADYYQGDNGVAQAQVDNNVTMQYGVTGNNPAFEQIIRVLNFFANDSTPLSQSNPADVANVHKDSSSSPPPRSRSRCWSPITASSKPISPSSPPRTRTPKPSRSTLSNRYHAIGQRDRDHPAQHPADPAPGLLPDDQHPAAD